MENINIESNIRAAINAYTKYNLSVPDGLKNWCIQHGREDLLTAESDNFLPSTKELAGQLGITLPDGFVAESREEPASEADISALLDLAVEQLAREIGVSMPKKPTGESKNRELSNAEIEAMLPSKEELARSLGVRI